MRREKEIRTGCGCSKRVQGGSINGAICNTQGRILAGIDISAMVQACKLQFDRSDFLFNARLILLLLCKIFRIEISSNLPGASGKG
jgi:hypothetical protein